MVPKVVLIAFLAVNLARACPNTVTEEVPKIKTEEYKFLTKLDHFDAQSDESFEFRYMSNGEHYKPGGPIFVYVGGPWPMYSYYIENGHFYDIATLEGAWLFANEHRFFGDSIPNGDLSTKNLKYLTIEQALADLAELITYVKQEIVGDGSAKVILMGAGYGGTVATYMRKQYPDLVDGVWSSSGRIEARLNFKEYAVLIGDMIRQYGDEQCYRRIQIAFIEAEILLLAGFHDTISTMFNTCYEIINEMDAQTFFYSVKQAIQYEILTHQTVESTKLLCQDLNNSTKPTSLQRLAEWIRNNTKDQDCNPYDFQSSLKNLQDLDISNPENKLWGKRQIAYQSCTEFGWFLTTDACHGQFFGHRVNMDYFYRYCEEIFEKGLTSKVISVGVERTNDRYGGQNQTISNVVFVNGELDPMRNVSIAEYHEMNSGAINIPEYFSSADMGSISKSDSPELVSAKLRIHEFIKSWLS